MIEVGNYVRTKNNGIKRIDIIFENKTINKYGYESGSDWDGKCYSYIKTTDILKHSKNIIDLIEIGDYVNGFEVIETDLENEVDNQIVVSTPTVKELYLIDNDIESIVTKEQFANIEYKVNT